MIYFRQRIIIRRGIVIGILFFIFLPAFPLFSRTLRTNPFERSEVKASLESFLGRERSFIQRGLNNMGYYFPIVRDILSTYRIPDEFIYLPLIESAYSCHAYSRAGAAGIWQFMPGTARYYGLKINFWVDERRDPVKSTKAAARHLNDLYTYYGDWGLTLAAYNAGIGSVNHAIRKGRSRNIWKLCRKGLLRHETVQYIPRFYAAVLIGKAPYAYGFERPDQKKTFLNVEIPITHPVDLTILCRKGNVPLKKLLFFNPELRRSITPPSRTYNLRVPVQYQAKILSVYHTIPAQDLISVKAYRVRSGQNLGEIAHLFRTDIQLIQTINSIRNPRRIYAGQKIYIPINNKNRDCEKIKEFLPRKGFYTQEISYTIEKGDNLWELARRFNTDVETLLAINGLSYVSILLPGDQITLWINIAFQR